MDRPSLLSVSISHRRIFDGKSPLKDRVKYSLPMAEVDKYLPTEVTLDGGFRSLGTQARS